MTEDETFMGLALDEARIAEEAGEVPVGCVIVHEGSVISRGHNLREEIQDPTAHAELLALRDAARALGTWRLSGATCYVTLEPCPMCAGALVNARVDRVVFGAEDPKAGATTTLYTIGTDLRLNHRFALTPGVRRDESAELLKRFFGSIREKRRR
jgi:tRNA(adenine34) deaminase